MNVLTFDIEEWALAKAGGYGSKEKYAEYDLYLDRILDAMDAVGAKGTFFCTGLMAVEFPAVVKRIDDRGHEVGCHSFRHTWMNKMSRGEAKEDTRKAVDALEQCIGRKIVSYRAPAFSIGENNKWMFDILAENGITRDSSVFPAPRDIGGFPLFPSKEPCIVEYNGARIKEFPINMKTVFHKDIAFSGGGYFRLCPLYLIEKWMNESIYCMFYFHINDLIPETRAIRSREEYERYFKEPGTWKNRVMRHMKTNIGKKNAWYKLSRIISNSTYTSLSELDSLLIKDNCVVRI